MTQKKALAASIRYALGLADGADLWSYAASLQAAWLARENDRLFMASATGAI